MRPSLRLLVPILCSLSLSLACGSSKEATESSSSSGSGSSGSSTGAGGSVMAGGIPDPGTSDQVDNDFTDVEPNNTPEQATPLGTAAAGDVGVWVNGNDIGGSGNPADYFVFRSGSTAGQMSFDICFGAPITAMTATLWKVEGGAQVTPPVGTWTSSATCVTNSDMGAALEASTVYLFGLTATGDAGSYSA